MQFLLIMMPWYGCSTLCGVIAVHLLGVGQVEAARGFAVLQWVFFLLQARVAFQYYRHRRERRNDAD